MPSHSRIAPVLQNQGHILGLQAMGDSEKSAFMRGQKTLEINPHHPLIQELKTLVRLGRVSQLSVLAGQT
jgi:HSP90 family molecular chaperone